MEYRALMLTVLATAVSIAVKSQTVSRKTAFGIRAGLNFQNLIGKEENGEKTDYKIKTGFHGGVTAEMPVAKDYFLQPGVLFSTKGTKYPDDYLARTADQFTFSYIELPVNFVYKPVLADGWLLFGFGPYAALAIAGKGKSGSGESDIRFREDQSVPTAAIFRRFDAGANFLAGYELANHFSLQFNVQLGMLNIYHDIKSIPSDPTSLKNAGFGISVGYKR